MSVRLSAYDLHKALTQIAPHVSDDFALPVLNAARLEVDGGNLFAIATDRFTMAVARVGIVETATWQAHIPAEQLPAVIAWLDAAGTVTITLEAATDGDLTRLTFDDGAGGLRVNTDTSGYSHFPDWRKYVSEHLSEPAGPVSDSGLDVGFLARWRHAGERFRASQAGSHKPLILMDDDATFIGMQMPVRWESAGRDELVGQWVRILAPAAATA
ncbi:hypothetical protein OG730_34730 [Streptomyces sp. NBC_01298]|uniref:DNA polymerase III subunit beta family protein n=1 Tax=Streptomyces sp. NBC_01298 TaxID=2903817 RepID=UPI002E11A006|nr:hypothetical protein OG730_34730 [Streptomyces sp. NBC_01298]